MNSYWTRNLRTPAEIEQFENSLKGSRIVLERLTQILTEEEDEIERSELNINTYETSSWSHKQAHKNGQRSMLRQIKQIINLDQQKDK